MKIKKSIKKKPKAAMIRTLMPSQNRRVFFPLNTGYPKILSMKLVKDNSSHHARVPKKIDHWEVKILLGHKSIESTERCIHIEKMLYRTNEDAFTVKVVNTIEEATALLEVGFEFHVGIEGK